MLFSVISELLPACTAFGFGEEVGKEIRFGQQQVIESDNIKCLCAECNNKKPQEMLTESEAVLYSVNTAENEYTDKKQTHNNDKYTAENSRCFWLSVDFIKPGFQSFLHIFRKVLCKSAIRHKYSCCQYHQAQQDDIAKC